MSRLRPLDQNRVVDLHIDISSDEDAMAVSEMVSNTAPEAPVHAEETPLEKPKPQTHLAADHVDLLCTEYTNLWDACKEKAGMVEDEDFDNDEKALIFDSIKKDKIKMAELQGQLSKTNGFLQRLVKKKNKMLVLIERTDPRAKLDAHKTRLVELQALKAKVEKKLRLWESVLVTHAI